MTAGEHRPADLLVFGRDSAGCDRLVTALDAVQLVADTATSLGDLRRAFFQNGGHPLLVLHDDLPIALARDAVATLRAIDATLDVLAFGHADELRSALPSTATCTEFHPTSRAGIGTIVRSVRTQRGTGG